MSRYPVRIIFFSHKKCILYYYANGIHEGKYIHICKATV